MVKSSKGLRGWFWDEITVSEHSSRPFGAWLPQSPPAILSSVSQKKNAHSPLTPGPTYRWYHPLRNKGPYTFSPDTVLTTFMIQCRSEKWLRKHAVVTYLVAEYGITRACWLPALVISSKQDDILPKIDGFSALIRSGFSDANHVLTMAVFSLAI